MNELRPDEEFVIKALAEQLEGNWCVGENPPDAYLKFKCNTVAVEISRLTQPVFNGTEFQKERHSDDEGALRLCDELDLELNDKIPKGFYVILHLTAPIQKLRRFKNLLAAKIIEYSSQRTECEYEDEIFKNKFDIHIVSGERSSGKKIVGIVSNSRSNANILANALYTLNDRLCVKSQKMESIAHDRECWLALFNDYWLADESTYKRAMSLSKITHPFSRIYVVFDSKKVIQIA
ncbi:MAG: hypothetical protein WAP34_03765 [Desulfomonilia bacterium]|jgi:hypothetical protein